MVNACFCSPVFPLIQEASADNGLAVITCCHLPVHPHTCLGLESLDLNFVICLHYLCICLLVSPRLPPCRKQLT